MLPIDLSGKRALVAGVADDGGFGFAIAKAMAEAGASICVGTWPPALNIFENLLRRGKMDESRRLSDGKMLEFERIYPLDAAYDRFEDAPEDVRANKRYVERGDFSIAGLATQLVKDFGEKPIDILVHSLANGTWPASAWSPATAAECPPPRRRWRATRARSRSRQGANTACG
jgi:enoyl-[acyl-carrier protein] reductase I